MNAWQQIRDGLLNQSEDGPYIPELLRSWEVHTAMYLAPESNSKLVRAVLSIKEELWINESD